MTSAVIDLSTNKTYKKIGSQYTWEVAAAGKSCLGCVTAGGTGALDEGTALDMGGGIGGIPGMAGMGGGILNKKGI